MLDMLTECSFTIERSLPLVCICSIFSFLCGVGIGGNDLSANFAMVVGSGSLNMRKAIFYCAAFEILGAAFMGGRVSNTIRNGIVDPALFEMNRDLVIIGMTCASFSAAAWLYISTVFGLPVSITHTVVGSILGFAIFGSGMSFQYVKPRGVVVIVISWLAAPLAACVVTAVIYEVVRRSLLKVKGRSFERTLAVLPYCLALSLLLDVMFMMIEKPPIMTVTFAKYMPLPVQYLLLIVMVFFGCLASAHWIFPIYAKEAWEQSSFVWESDIVRTTVNTPKDEDKGVSTGEDESSAAVSPATKENIVTSPMIEVLQPAPSAAPEGTQSLPVPTATPLISSLTPSGERKSPMMLRVDSVMGSSLTLDKPRPKSANLKREPSVPPSARRHEGNKIGDPGKISLEDSVMRLTSLVPSDSKVVSQCSVHVEPVTRGPQPEKSSKKKRHCIPIDADCPFKEMDSKDVSFAEDMGPRSTPPPFGADQSSPVQPGAAAPAAAPDTDSKPLLSALKKNKSYISVSNDTFTEELMSSKLKDAAAQRPQVNYGTIELPVEVSPEEQLKNVSFIFTNMSPLTVQSEDTFADTEWGMDHPMQPIRFGGMLVKPYNPRAEYLFTGIQVVSGAMSSFVHGAVAGANATAAFVILYDTFTRHELNEKAMSSQWAAFPAMLGIAIGMYSLGSTLMKTVGVELVTVTPARGWCIQVGGTVVTMILTGCGIPVSLSQSQVGAAIGCGLLDAGGRPDGVAWGIVLKIILGWVVTLVISATTTGVSMWLLTYFYCG